MESHSITVKQEPVDDYVFEYKGAPSPEVPIYGLVPLRNIFPNEMPSSSMEFEECTSEREEASEPSHHETCVPDSLPNMWNTVPENVPESMTEQVTGNEIKAFKDASTNTCIVLLESLYKTRICRICNLPIMKNTVTVAKKITEERAETHQKSKSHGDVEPKNLDGSVKESEIMYDEESVIDSRESVIAQVYNILGVNIYVDLENLKNRHHSYGLVFQPSNLGEIVYHFFFSLYSLSVSPFYVVTDIF